MEDNPYEVAFRRAADPAQRQTFWKEEAQNVEWFRFPQNILDASNPPFARWYGDGLINITYNMFDRYLKDHPNQKSLIWVSNMVNQQKVWTLKENYENVCKMGRYLRSQGVEKGDRVIIYMPQIPEALWTAWACARIGAVHSIVFGGFAAKELASRINDCSPKAIVLASCGLQPHKQVNYVSILQEALSISSEKPNILIKQRPDHKIEAPPQWSEFDIEAMPFEDLPAQPMKSTDYLYILYTSGTTGSPKGIVRDQGGTTVALNWTMDHIMGINQGDTYFSAGDIGWVVGHSFGVYGPLIRGAATLLYEGKPTLPNPGAIWSLVDKYKPQGLYTSPTGLRAIRKQDNDGAWIDKYDVSSLKAISMAGERCDIPTYEWIQRKTKVLINDNYWQTQCGWIISCNYANLYTFPSKPGSATKPGPGFVVEIINHLNQPAPKNTLGKVCIRLPMPPSFMNTLYNNDQGFLEKYMNQTPGYYTTGDAGYFDNDGYLNVMTRLDDIINTAGHRLSTAAMEEVLLTHPSVSEAAVVAKIEELKGEIPIGFVVIKSGKPRQGIQKELVQAIRKEIGPVACFQIVIIVDKLPKTRSGKILRHILRKLLEGEPYKYPATIEDDSVLGIIEKQVKQFGHGLGKKSGLTYRGDVDSFDEKFGEAVELINQGSYEELQEINKKIKPNQGQ